MWKQLRLATESAVSDDGAAKEQVNSAFFNRSLAAAISKLVKSDLPQDRDSSGNRTTNYNSAFAMRELLQKRARRNNDAKMILQILPDLELGLQIIVSSILSPRDMTSLELIYTSPKNIFSPELSASLLGQIKEHFESVYPIKKYLSRIVRESLGEEGSYTAAVIPENVIDDFINGSIRRVATEAFSDLIDLNSGKPKNIGILGSPIIDDETSTSLKITLEDHSDSRAKVDNRMHFRVNDSDVNEQWKINPYVTVTDNPLVLRMPSLRSTLRSSAVTNVMKKRLAKVGYASESATLSDHRLEQAIYANRQFQHQPIAVLKRQHEMSRRSVGAPLVMRLPSESVLPVYVPGNVESHIGYFVILDEEGNPLQSNPNDPYFQGLSQSSGKGAMTSALISRIHSNFGSDAKNLDPTSAMHVEYAAKVYADMVERDFLARIRNSTYGMSATIARNEELYRIMLSRTLQKKFTQVLFMPIEYVTYFAFKYGEDGIGRSLLDDAVVINSLRSAVLFADTVGQVKNAIGRTHVEVTLDPKDPDPLGTAEKIQDEFVRSNHLNVPMGISHPNDMSTFVQRAAVSFSFKGHPGLPEVTIQPEQKQTGYQRPDSDLQESLKKASSFALGLSPETIDSAQNAEFATTVVSNNILLAKRILQYQEVLTPLLSDHLRKVAIHSELLYKNLMEAVSNNLKSVRLSRDDLQNEIGMNITEELFNKIIAKHALDLFLASFEVELPKPNSVTLEAQLQEFKTYCDALDETIKAYIFTDFATDSTVGQLSGEINTISEVVKAYFKRKKLAQMGFMTELAELTTQREDGGPMLNLFEEMSEHIKGLGRSGVTLLARFKPMIQAIEKDMSGNELGGSSGSSYSSDTGSSDNTESSSGDDFGSDFGGEADAFGGTDDAGVTDDAADASTDASADDAAAQDEAELEPTEEPGAL